MTTRPHKLLLAAQLVVTSACASGCADPESFFPNYQDLPGSAEGVLDGTVTYSGPLPCTEKKHVVGAAVILVFDTRLLPPPEGLGTSAASLAAVGGDDLFAGVVDRLTFTHDGSRWCPAPGGPQVTVSSTWAASPIGNKQPSGRVEGGEYEVRGFYDLDGNFDPGFGISNEPTKGDIGGGAIDNVVAAANGAVPAYRKIALGELEKDGTRTIPASGSHIGEIAVTLGLPLPLDRPVFNVTGVLDPNNSKPDPQHVVMASDFQLGTFSITNLANTETSLLRLTFGAGVAASEAAEAVKSPFFLPKDPVIVYSRQDVNGDGKIDATDHTPLTNLLPALFPLAIFSKLCSGGSVCGSTVEANTQGGVQPLVAQGTPAVIIQAVTLYKSLGGTVGANNPTFTSVEQSALFAIPPAALCIDPTAPATQHAVLMITHQTDTLGHVLIMDEAPVAQGLEAQFGRPVDIVYGCMPEGTYAMNVVYGTGQTWTLPNEAGICADSEKAAGTKCGTRPRLASQDAVLTIGPPGDASYCKAHPAPSACTFKPPPP